MKDTRDYHLLAYTNHVVRRMFVETADGNYILARSAYFLRLPFDFYWLGMHALEKYYKAILLMNGLPARGFGHDLAKLSKEARKLAGGLLKTKFTRLQAPGLRWSAELVDHYVARLNRFGSAHNRYATYGYWILEDDLFKLDQLVWQVRRCCRPFYLEMPVSGGEPIAIDAKRLLRKNKHEWRVSSWPLEELIDGPKDDPRRSAFLLSNLPFAPDQEHRLPRMFSASHTPPLADWFRQLRANARDPSVQTSADQVLGCISKNVDFGREDRKLLENDLREHAVSRSLARKK